MTTVLLPSEYETRAGCHTTFLDGEANLSVPGVSIPRFQPQHVIGLARFAERLAQTFAHDELVESELRDQLNRLAMNLDETLRDVANEPNATDSSGNS
jgi:hypothetical protein